jgi:23S rRNA (guanosine2251-2'-O)-methyltransferase
MDYIAGVHSIYHAIQNNQRPQKLLLATSEGLEAFLKKTKQGRSFLDKNNVQVELFNSQDFVAKTQRLFQESKFEYFRLPGTVLLKCSALPILQPNQLTNTPNRIIALDQITDVHNAGAILRTAAFFNIDAVIMESKGESQFPPSFFRIASGAVEYVKIIRTTSLLHTLKGFKNKGIRLVGFSEEASADHTESHHTSPQCLVFGAEEVGISHAIERILDANISLDSNSPIKSLNVSVACALGIQKIFTP